MRDIIAAGLEELGLSNESPPEAPELLEAYGRALLEKNQVMNLTAYPARPGGPLLCWTAQPCSLRPPRGENAS